MFVFIFWKFLLLSFGFFSKVLSNSILIHSHLINFGRFYFWEDCPFNSFANGFEVKADCEDRNFSDEEGMTGLRLRCSNQRDEEVGLISSYSTSDGTWRGSRRCSPGEWLTGFRIRIQGYGWWIRDDTTANDIEMMCNNSQIFNGGGNSIGQWTEWNECENGEVICGLQTKVEDVYTIDRVGLVAVQFRCCDLTFNDTNETGEFSTSTESQVSDSSLISDEPILSTSTESTSFSDENSTSTDNLNSIPFGRTSAESQVSDSTSISDEYLSTSTESPSFLEELLTSTESQVSDSPLISEESISISTESPSFSELLTSTESQVSDSTLISDDSILSTSTESPPSVSDDYKPSDYSSNIPTDISTTAKPYNSSFREIIFPDTIISYRKYDDYFTKTRKGAIDNEAVKYGIIQY